MKPGCILKLIFGVIFIIGVGSYVLKTYGPGFRESVESRAKTVIKEKIDRELTTIKDSLLRIEMNHLVEDYFTGVKDSALSVVEKSGDSLTAFLGSALKDSLLDNHELFLLRKIIKNE